MDTQEGKEHRSAGDLDEETVARRRSRRVSFAETTAVHVFDRDDSSDTPHEKSPSSSDSAGACAGAGGAAGDGWDSDNTSREGDEEEEGEEGSIGPPVRFVRDMDSSPGSSSAASVASNDDENFFGPVSLSFLRSGSRRFSDSGISDDNNHSTHDVTLDSTAFSLHFRSIGGDRSVNSAGSLKTPTEAEPSGSLTDPARGKRMVKRSKISDEKSSGGLTDFSLVKDNPSSYDFGKFSPTLNNLLNEVDKSLQPGEGQINSRVLTPVSFDKDRIGTGGNLATVEVVAPVSQSIDDKPQGSYKDIHETTIPSNKENLLPHSSPLKSFSDHLAITSIQSITTVNYENPMQTPKATIQTQFPKGSVSSLRAKRQQLFGDPDQPPPSLQSELLKHGQRISAIKDSISKKVSTISTRLNFENRRETVPEKMTAISSRLNFEINPLSYNSNNNNDDINNNQDMQDYDLDGRKRRMELNFDTEDRPVKHTRTQISPKLVLNSSDNNDSENINNNNSNNNSSSNNSNKNSNNNSNTEDPVVKHMRTQRSPNISVLTSVNSGTESVKKTDWTELVSNLSELTKLVFSEAVDRLSLHELDLLEDKLEKLQMARKYLTLCASLRNPDWTDPLQQRLAEARTLQDKYLYEKAKLQLNRLKIEKLNSKAKLISQSVQECSLLESKISQFRNSSPQISETTDCNLVAKIQEEENILNSKRNEFKSLEQKVEKSRESLQVSCNLREDLSCDELTNIAKENLEMKNHCRAIHQDLRLWELHDIVKKGNQCEIVLNYCNMLFQRFTADTKFFSNIVMKNSLDESKIEKTFRKMNACSVFEFVFRVKKDQRIDSLKNLQHETLETSLLLGNLIDILDEIQTTKMEILNLTCANFYFVPTNPWGQLELQLCFMNFKSGRKVAFTVGMSDLKRAIYPSEASELQIEIMNSKTTLAQSVLDEIMNSVKSIRSGRLMLLRLCQTVSRIVHSSSD